MSLDALCVEGVSKRFGNAPVLDGVTLKLRPREMVGLVGANGAGKSTLLKVLGGLLSADAGEMVLRGRVVRWRGAAHATSAGVASMHQELSCIPGITVAEAIFLGIEQSAVRFGIIRWRRLFERARSLLQALGADVSPDAPTESLDFPQQRIVALARVVALAGRGPEEPIVLLDEPTAGLDAACAGLVLRQVEQLKSRASVLFVSHDVRELLRTCDRIYVLRAGRCVAERDARDCTVEEVRRLMLEDHGEGGRPGLPIAPGLRPVRLAVKGLQRKGHYAEVDFILHEGEILGIAGRGSEAICRALFGIEPPDSGAILLDGCEVVLRSPADAAASGIGYVPADRGEALIGAMSVAGNVTLAHLGRFRAGWCLDRRGEQTAVAGWIERLRIAVPSAQGLVRELSGGNQQKVALAKWLVGGPRVLILHHPMRGLDAAARADVRDAIREAAARGTSIVLPVGTTDELPMPVDSVLVTGG